MKYLLCLLLLLQGLEAKGKILICGVCKNVVTKLPTMMQNMTACGEAYDDYQIIIYENNSKDGTDKLLKQWMKKNHRVTAFTKNLSAKELRDCCLAGHANRVEIIAMARNQVLQEAMKGKYDDFDFLLMADMDLANPWDIKQIVSTTSRTDIEWDAVFANGLLPDGRFYDMFAYRGPKHPLGPEMLGDWWWKNHGWCTIPQDAPWQPVYSAFNGLAIYKRSSLKGSWYSGVVTPELDIVAKAWIDQAERENHPWLTAYHNLIQTIPIYSSRQVHSTLVRKAFPPELGLVLAGSQNSLIWFLHRQNSILPEVCEHVALHASMTVKGKGRFFINPSLLTYYHE